MKTFSRVLKSGLLAWILIVIVIGIWISFRTRIIEQYYRDLSSSWLSDAHIIQIVLLWFLAWFLISLALSLVCSGFFYWWIQKHHWKALHFALVLCVLGTSLCLAAFLADNKILTLAAGEIMIITIGYACFLPWLAQKELREYY
ncbi:MAG TPA: hypothetical protein VLH15_09165 [Dehalococcoidales bacterium]|nr:hypothetical protein [Dehalococcoidales bacterium]